MNNRLTQAELQGALHEAIAEEQYQSTDGSEREYREAVDETIRLTRLLHGDIEQEGDQRPATDKIGVPKCWFIKTEDYVFMVKVTREGLIEDLTEQIIECMRDYDPQNNPGLLGRDGLLAPLKKALTHCSKGELGEALASYYKWYNGAGSFIPCTKDQVGDTHNRFSRDMGVLVLEAYPHYQRYCQCRMCFEAAQ